MFLVLFRHNKTPKVFCLTFGGHIIFLKRPDVFKKRLGEFEFCLRVKIFGVGGKVRCRMFHHLLVSEVLMFR